MSAVPPSVSSPTGITGACQAWGTAPELRGAPRSRKLGDAACLFQGKHLFLLLFIALMPHAHAAKNCSARQLACKPSCKGESSSGGKDQLGNAAVLRRRLCKMCKCKQCEWCSAHGNGDDPVLSVVQHPGPYMKPGVRRAAKHTTRFIGSGKLKGNSSKEVRAVGGSSIGSTKRRRKDRSGASRQHAERGTRATGSSDSSHSSDSGASGASGASDRLSGDAIARARDAPHTDPLADRIGQVLLAVSVAGALLVLANMLRNCYRLRHTNARAVATTPSPLRTLDDNGIVSTEPSPRLSADEPTTFAMR